MQYRMSALCAGHGSLLTLRRIYAAVLGDCSEADVLRLAFRHRILRLE